MRRRTVMISGLLSLWAAAACQALDMKPGFGVVIRSALAPGSKPKQGVSGVTDTGQRFFGFYLLDAKQADTGHMPELDFRHGSEWRGARLTSLTTMAKAGKAARSLRTIASKSPAPFHLTCNATPLLVASARYD